METKSSIRAHLETEDDDTKQVYDVSIFDKTILATVTMHPDAVTQWIDDLKDDGKTGVRYVIFEYEFDHNISRIGTLQLCVGSRCLIFQLPRTPLAPSLDQFLGNKKNVFVGINILSKMDKLRKQCPFAVVAVYKDMGEPLPELRDAQRSILDRTDTDWARPMKLSHKQALYACIDAFLILQIGTWLGYI